MNKEKISKVVESCDVASSEFSVDKASSILDALLLEYNIKDEGAQLFQSMLLCLASAFSIKNEIVKILKSSSKTADLSASLLVDVDTRFELLLAHCLWLFDNSKSKEFDSQLRSGARLSEEFFSDLVYKVSKLQRTLTTELGISEPSLKKSSILTLIRNINEVNTYLSELLGKLPNRYDSLSSALLLS